MASDDSIGLTETVTGSETVETKDRPVEADELSPEDELYRVAELTNPDGTVDATVLEWQKTGKDDSHGPSNMVGVEIEGLTPTGERFTDTYAWPEYDDPDEFTFIEIVEAAGYDLTQASHVNSDPNATVRARKTDSGWTFDPERPTPPRRTRLKRRLADLTITLSKDGDMTEDFWIAFLFSPLLIPMFILLYPFEDPGEMGVDAEGYAMAMWHILLWVLIVIAIAVAV